MSSQYEQLKTEVRELIFFTVKLLLHWLVLVIILIFVLITVWIHQLFRQSFSIIESVPADAKEAGISIGSVRSSREPAVKNNHVERLRNRRKRTLPANQKEKET
jgi:cytochrome b561